MHLSTCFRFCKSAVHKLRIQVFLDKDLNLLQELKQKPLPGNVFKPHYVAKAATNSMIAWGVQDCPLKKQNDHLVFHLQRTGRKNYAVISSHYGMWHEENEIHIEEASSTAENLQPYFEILKSLKKFKSIILPPHEKSKWARQTLIKNLSSEKKNLKESPIGNGRIFGVINLEENERVLCELLPEDIKKFAPDDLMDRSQKLPCVRVTVGVKRRRPAEGPVL
eukprot:GHVP01026185.1.p1 GENE.GHVP01026185.1~~GHVP01026185.1.p1  ORF type:complete len:222 (+),score=38.06 GHVP01026185.1:221-886(+)